MTEVALLCIKRELIVVIENPRRSFYWLTSFFQPLASLLTFTAHQACAYGSTRPKWTVLAHNCKTFERINKCCPGLSLKHKHDAWGLTAQGFATSQETAYPLQLAYEIAHAFASEAVHRGWKPPSGVLTPPDRVKYAYLRAVVGSQPKASKIAPVLSEYATVITVSAAPTDVPVQPGHVLDHPWNDIPAGAKFLRHAPLRSKGGGDSKNISTCSFGVFQELHEKLAPHARKILAPKRILLWKALLQKYEYPDLGVVDEVCQGTKLTGPIAPVPVFERAFKPASLTEEELRLGAKASRDATVHSVRSSGDEFVDSEVYRKTCEERNAGWIRGPFALEDLPPDAIVSRRFGLKQGEKVRLIDDLSGSGVNQTTQAETTPALHTLDVVAAMLLQITRWGKEFSWVGKTVDLSAAYRQLAISEDSLWASYVACFNPHSRRPEVYQLMALPFGATSSVYGFLRVAHSLWFLGCRALCICWTSFFDDFVTLARTSEAEVLDGVIKKFFGLLGWTVSGGEKDVPFGGVFKALGVQISFEQMPMGVALLTNTQKRVAELCETIQSVLDDGGVSRAQGLSLRGRMQFAHAQIWGRASRMCLNAVTEHAYGNGRWQLAPGTTAALKHFLTCLRDGHPRRVGGSATKQWFVFTDASFQPTDDSWPCGTGGVLYNDKGEVVSAFSLCLDGPELKALGFPGKKTVIFEGELLAIIVALKLWEDKIRNSPCLIFVDNNSARDVAISGRARSRPAHELVGALLRTEDSLSVTPWVARVPSSSNPADEPSRKGSTAFNEVLADTSFVRQCMHFILASAMGQMADKGGKCEQ